jgi:hypothetical protein
MLLLCSLPAGLSAQDAYHGGPLDARQHGFQHGYRQGFAFGRDRQVSNRDQDMVNQQLRAADRDYDRAFGPQDEYRQGFAEGFRAGMEDSRSGARSRLEDLFRSRDPNYDPDRNHDDRVDGIYAQNRWPVKDVAGDVGYRDGLNAGMRDRQENRGFQPQKHGAWKDGSHGYTRDLGSQGAYKRQYRAAYEAGYRDGFGGRSR